MLCVCSNDIIHLYILEKLLVINHYLQIGTLISNYQILKTLAIVGNLLYTFKSNITVAIHAIQYHLEEPFLIFNHSNCV